MVEHKHVTATEAANGVLHDSSQLRAQRTVAAANNGVHELIISTDLPLRADGTPAVRLSGPLGRSAETTMYFFDTRTRQVTHSWNRDTGSWQPI